jgi:hypothetical protein
VSTPPSPASLRDEPPPSVAVGDGPEPPARPAALGDLGAVLATYLALGVVGGLLWWLLCDPALFTVTRDGGVAMGEAELSKRFDPDAWYAVIAAVLGLVSGVAVTWWRSRDPLLTIALVLVGSAVAAAVMTVVGGWLGPTDPETLAAGAQAGARLPAPLTVDAPGAYVVWPVAALLGALVVLWSPAPTD